MIEEGEEVCRGSVKKSSAGRWRNGVDTTARCVTVCAVPWPASRGAQLAVVAPPRRAPTAIPSGRLRMSLSPGVRPPAPKSVPTMSVAHAAAHMLARGAAATGRCAAPTAAPPPPAPTGWAASCEPAVVPPLARSAACQPPIASPHASGKMRRRHINPPSGRVSPTCARRYKRRVAPARHTRSSLLLIPCW